MRTPPVAFTLHLISQMAETSSERIFVCMTAYLIFPAFISLLALFCPAVISWIASLLKIWGKGIYAPSGFQFLE